MFALLNNKIAADTTAEVAPVSTDLHAGTCSTCQGWTESSTDVAHLATATCPACGVASVEYAMIVEMDAILADLGALDAIDKAFAAL